MAVAAVAVGAAVDAAMAVAAVEVAAAPPVSVAVVEVAAALPVSAAALQESVAALQESVDGAAIISVYTADARFLDVASAAVAVAAEAVGAAELAGYGHPSGAG
jgi:hypothetical protein